MLNPLKIRIVLIESLPEQLKIIGAVAVYVFIFIFVYTPFNVASHGFQLQSWIAFLYGAISFIIPSLFGTLKHYMDVPFFDKNEWTVGKEISYALFMLLPISFLFLLVDIQYNGEALNFLSYCNTLKKVLLIAILPMMILLVIKKNMLLRSSINQLVRPDMRRHRYPNKNSSTSRTSIPTPINPIASVQIHSDNKSESLSLIARNFMFAVSERNYIDIHYLENGKPIKKTIRTTIKQLQIDLKDSSFIVKCHRSYLVNSNKIESFEGNSRGYKISLGRDLPTIPVARNYIENLKSMIKYNH